MEHNVRYKRLKKTKYRHKIHEAYRGGRSEAFQTGSFEHLMRIDANSLYPYLAVEHEYPALGTDQYIHNPTKQGIDNKWLFSNMGVSNVILKTPNFQNRYGCIPVRVKVDNEETTFYPVTREHRSFLVGTWTHIELNRALEEGYELLYVDWSVIYQQGKNPFRGYIDVLYKKRQQTTNKFDNQYFKLLMNGCLGKFGSNRHKKDFTYKHLSEHKSLIGEGWEPIFYFPNGMVSYSKDLGFDRKPFYAPIWSAYITAYGRDYLYTHMKNIPPEKLYYCDTDGLLCDTNTKEIRTFKYDKKLGNWKVEEKDADATIYGRKAMIHGNKITLNRVPKSMVNKQKMQSGLVEYTEPLSLGRGGLQAGKTIYAMRDLNKQQEKEEERKQYTQRFYIDTNTTLNNSMKEKMEELF